MKLKPAYSSHLPVLIKILSITTGDVVELGAGIYSTPVLHWMCSPKKRKLVSYDNSEKCLSLFNLRAFEDEFHKVVLVDNWDDVELEKQQWDVAFIDHSPERRAIEVARLAYLARYIIIHDSDWRNERHYHYKKIYGMFKYRYDYTIRPWTTVLSNFVDLKDFSA